MGIQNKACRLKADLHGKSEVNQILYKEVEVASVFGPGVGHDLGSTTAKEVEAVRMLDLGVNMGPQGWPSRSASMLVG
nr:hypothetical protein Itr_chr12CG07780 [Ipomoea trifida]